MELGASLTRRADVADRESLVERHRDERRLAGARMPLHADALGVAMFTDIKCLGFLLGSRFGRTRPRVSRHLLRQGQSFVRDMDK